jgi:hypothetical protein
MRRGARFRVLPATPDYLLRWPDSTEVPFPKVLGVYTSVGSGWVELRPQMELRVENAYFREGAPKRGLANFLGTEIVRYRVKPTGGLEQIALESRLPQRPADQPPVQQLIRESQRGDRHYRLFFQVLLNKKSDIRSAVLLSAASGGELDPLAEKLLSEPESVCSATSPKCTVFPEACTVSLEIAIVVNGAPKTVLWSSSLMEVAPNNQRVELLRPYRGRLIPVEIDPSDSEALHLPLLPGDRVRWRQGGQ